MAHDSQIVRAKENAQQNIEQLQKPTMWVTIHNESAATEPPP